MKKIIILFVVFCQTTLFSKDRTAEIKFTNAEIKEAKTAVKASYLTDQEKEIFYYMNLARINPKKFYELYLKDGTGSMWAISTKYYKSLVQTLKTMKPLPPIKPDKTLYLSALCLADEQSASGETGHSRKENCYGDYYAECCSYGVGTGLSVVLNLLIDEGVPSLGHRKILFGNYSKMGTRLKSGVAVLDFK